MLRAPTPLARKVIAAAALAALTACSQGRPGDTAASTPPAAPARDGAARALPDFTAIVQQCGPAVVNVQVVQREAPTGVGSSGGDDQEDPSAASGSPRAPAGATVRGIGAGFIVQSDGVVLTNAHVVENASEVTVRLTDRREFRAKVVGVDEETDIAVLRIDARGLPTVRVGDDARVRVGEWVLAIGSPFGFENSVTAGVISARARSLPGQGYVRYLQTDVAVNPGNSGGPIFDLAGEVIGVTSQIYSASGGFMGISFAIPIGTAMEVERQLLRTGKVTRGFLGVSVQDMDPDLARSFGLARPPGPPA
jgi:serine protease Do